MNFLETILLFCIGGIITMLIDVVWWRIDYKKAEKGMEILEHYHMGIALFIAAVVIHSFYTPMSWLMAGMGFMFVFAEWHQTIEIAGKKVVPGKPFAYGSKHFKQSSIIGIILAVFLLIISLVL